MTTPDAALLDGREALLGALREMLLDLPARSPQRVALVDAEFAEWPLDDPAVLDALARWARPAGRQLWLIGQDFDALQRQRPRFAAWRRDWTHRAEAWRPIDLSGAGLPAWLLAGEVGVEWLDRVHWRGRRVVEPAMLRSMGEVTDAIQQRCEPAWPATTLGL